MNDTSHRYTPLPDMQEYEHINSSSLTQRQQRSLVFHLLYAVDAFEYEVTLTSVAENLSRGFGYIIAPEDQVFTFAHAVIEKREELDAEIQPLLAKWRFERIGVATRLILRYAIWELKYREEEHNVIINEAVELAKCFAELEAYKFINGILDRWVKEHHALDEHDADDSI